MPLPMLRALLSVCLCCVSAEVIAQGLAFDVTLDRSVTERPITGRLFVFLSTRATREPRFGPDWFRPEPFFGVDVRDFKPGESRQINDAADGFPDKLSKLPAGKYQAQALLDHDFYDQDHAKGAGNFYSAAAEIEVVPSRETVVAFTLDRTIPERRFRETVTHREVSIRSDLLSKFHGREVLEKAAVILPPSYDQQPERRYPVLYVIPGFGGSHLDAQFYGANRSAAGEGETEFIRVMLSGNCKWGHHVYADSATNGPRGQALVEELIPHIDRTYRTVARPTARFVSGHSSGGWSSLWLQVTYPEFFGGVWSTSPDPVTFTDYQGTNLYAEPPQSLYVDPQGQRRPIARRGQTPVLWYDSFGKMDDCLGRGGQLRSFEAVFSPLGEDGLPRKLWDRKTGQVDPRVAEAWKAYDIRLILERNWPTLSPKLSGKLHIIMGSLDTFYLEGAVVQLAASLKSLGSDAEVVIVPGADHGTVLTQELNRKIRRQMSAKYLEHHGTN